MSAARFRESWRDLLYAMNRRPEESWKAQAAHHGVRAAVVLALAFGLPLLFSEQAEVPSEVEIDEVAPADVFAELDVDLPKPEADLRRERDQAARAVLPRFRFDESAADSSASRVAAFLEELGEAFDAEGAITGPEVERVLASYDVTLGPSQLEYLRSASSRNDILGRLARAYRELLPPGVVAPASVGAAERLLLISRTAGPRSVRADSLVTVGEFVEEAYDFAPGDTQGFRAFQGLALAFAVPSLRPDPEAWVAAQDSARAAVDSTIGQIKDGERLLTAGERVTRADYDRLVAYNRAIETRRESIVVRGRRYAARALFGVLLLGLVGVTLLLYREELYRELRHFLIVMALVGGTAAGAALVEQVPAISTAFIPIVVAALVIGAVYDGLYALVVVFATALLLMGLDSALTLFDALPLALGGAVAALGVRRVRRRRQSWALIAGITAAFAGGVLAFALLGGYSPGSLLGMLLWGFVGATLYTVLTLGGLVPLLEKVTGISTAQTLLELSDLNAPLLRELSLKAPGTYAHSINIANLAEAACEAIGADSLLARAGAYYHDIGKMVNPQYFVENQPKGRNPHDRLPPLRSAAIIRDHVRDGVRLATENRLPPRIHDFIREHHGTGLIRFFHDKAVEEAGEDASDVNPADFAYLGPKPQTRESAVIMMADGIESATRVLGDPTPERIRATIQAIADARLAEGQLDQCPLTLREIDLSKAAFARVLIGMYHRRIDYPSGIRSRDDAAPPAGTPADADAPRPASRKRVARTGPEDQLEAALEAADVADVEASVRAADE